MRGSLAAVFHLSGIAPGWRGQAPERGGAPGVPKGKGCPRRGPAGVDVALESDGELSGVGLVEQTVLKGLRQVWGADLGAPFQVGDGAGHAAYAIYGPR